jgi:hypothetical protein
MSISKNVIRDLLPVYAAGEASEDTRALVAEACAGDPELLAEVNSLGAVPIPEAAPPAELGIASLRRTQKLLRERTFLVGFCFYFTMLPVAFLDRPFSAARLLATLCLAVAIAGWGAFLRNSARLQATGLEPPRTQWPVMAWQVGAWVFSFSAASVVGAWMGRDFLNHPQYAILFVIWAPIMLLGRKLNQYREPEAIFRTETLFTLTREAESKEE